MADYKITVKRHDIAFNRSHYYLEIANVDHYQPGTGHPPTPPTPVFSASPTVTVHGFAFNHRTNSTTLVGNDSDQLVFSVHDGTANLKNPILISEKVVSYTGGTPSNVELTTYEDKQQATKFTINNADEIYQHIAEIQSTINGADLKYLNSGFVESQNSNTIIRAILEGLGFTDTDVGIDFTDANNSGAERSIITSSRTLDSDEALERNEGLLQDQFDRHGKCFAAGTLVRCSDGSQKPIEQVEVGDEVLAYDATDRNGQGTLTPGRVTRVYATPNKLVIDFHGLNVTPGHVFLCGDGEHTGQHRMLMEILRSDGTIVHADGAVLRAAINAPIGSREDAFVQVAYLTDNNNALMQSGRMRAGTLILTADSETKSVLQCIEEEGYRFHPQSGLIAKDGEAPHPLYWYGEIPRPEDYILKRSDLTDADLYAEPDYRPEAASAPARLAQGLTPSEGTLPATAAKRAGETIH